MTMPRLEQSSVALASMLSINYCAMLPLTPSLSHLH